MNGLTVEQYLKWKNEGLKDSDILEKLHYSSNSQLMLMKWKKANGIGQTRQSAKKYTRKKADNIDINQVRKLRKQKYTSKEIAEILGISFKYYKDYFLPTQFKNGKLTKIIGG